jgi:hypothetical protein
MMSLALASSTTFIKGVQSQLQTPRQGHDHVRQD